MPRGLTSLRAWIPSIALAALCLSSAWAGPREDAAAAMARCDLIRENDAWLVCHEKATAQMRAALGAAPRALPPAPPPVASLPPRPAQSASAAQSFGEDNLARLRPAPAKGPRRLVARVTDVSFSRTGYFTIGLENGQWWRQTDGDVAYARFREPANRNVISIERGFMGSYNLHIQGLSQGYKVTRLR